MMRCASTALVVLSLTVVAPSQELPSHGAAPSTPRPTFGAAVELVEVDAVVTDGDGRQVTDLKAEDFDLREHGRP